MTPAGWILLVVALGFAYASSVTAFLALQNRTPQSTFARVLLFVLCPPAALLTYVVFGRGRHAFSRELTMTKLLDRSTLADWVGCGAFPLRPVHERLWMALRASPKLFADVSGIATGGRLLFELTNAEASA